MKEWGRIVGALVFCTCSGCGQVAEVWGTTSDGSPTVPPIQSTGSAESTDALRVSEPRVKWTHDIVLTDQFENVPVYELVSDVSVALNPNGTTGLFVEYAVPGPYGPPGRWRQAEVRTLNPAGHAMWRKISDKSQRPWENAAFNDSYEIKSWSTSFVVLRQGWRASSFGIGIYSFGCQRFQNPKDGYVSTDSFAMFFDTDGVCLRLLGLGSSAWAFAADPAGNVRYQFTIPGMAGASLPPRMVDSTGAFLFNGGARLGGGPIYGNFDPSTMLEGPFTVFEDGRIFGSGVRRPCPTCPPEPVWGPLRDAFLPAWTAKGDGWGPYDVGDGDAAMVAYVPGPISFGRTTLPAGDGLVAFRYDSNGAPKLAVRVQPPFEGAQLIHLDKKGFVFASTSTDNRVAAVGWNGTTQWLGTIPCGGPWSPFAGNAQHGLRFACRFGGENGAPGGVRLVAIKR
jgi:hypothetical protein